MKMRKTKRAAKLAAQAAEQAAKQAKLDAKAAHDRIIAGTVAARLGIIAYELDLLIAACGGDLDGQSLAWLKVQAVFFHGAADTWRARSSSETQWGLAGG